MILKLFVSLLIPQLIGGLGALVTTPNISTWYASLNKPFFNPPSWLFGPVWTLLFLAMGIALYQIWTKKKSLLHKSLHWFWAQLLLNLVWSFLFFGLKNPLFSFTEIIFLWFAIYKTIQTFYKINRPSGLILVPYLAWVSFASLLNIAIFWLNK